ncbi:hypothetical protein B296_00030758 [Ensete ventricosum]|uniref:Uncharacterized protein n=1 Tax=Ensete ventricosum TaxID=4639 RepID=A0A426ZAR6_ENSVE|nr:hypothetical protein B296_00030758 [Ensete ventricosum]
MLRISSCAPLGRSCHHMLRASEPKVLGNQLVLDLGDEGGSRYEILPKLLFRHDELLLDFIYPVVHQVKLYPEQVRRVGGECIWLKIVVDGGTSGEHRSQEVGHTTRGSRGGLE